MNASAMVFVILHFHRYLSAKVFALLSWPARVLTDDYSFVCQYVTEKSPLSLVTNTSISPSLATSVSTGADPFPPVPPL